MKLSIFVPLASLVFVQMIADGKPSEAVVGKADLVFPGEKIDEWNGYKRHVFSWDGCQAWVVEPVKSLPENPWSWCMEFPNAFTKRCAALQLLEKGFHHAHIEVGNTFGSPAAVAHFESFHAELARRGLSRRPALIGISRGGLYAGRFAAKNPDKVSVIYGDNAVFDFKSWPGGKAGGKGSKGDWQSLIKHYGFADEAAALAYPENPVDRLEPMAKAGIAFILVAGDADDVVPAAENSILLEKRYRALGGVVEVIHKPGAKHHPHGLDDPTPVVDFILRHTKLPKD